MDAVRRGVVAVGVGLLVLLPAAGAAALWPLPTTHVDLTARSGVLHPVDGLVVGHAPGGGTAAPPVRLSWTAGTGPVDGYRVWRTSSAGTQLAAALGAGATGFDDAVGAGRYAYAVEAHIGDWTATAGPAGRTQTYGFARTAHSDATGAACTGRGMWQGFTPVAPETLIAKGTATLAFCSPAFTSAQVVPAGAVEVAVTTQGFTRACDIAVTLSVPGTGLSLAMVLPVAAGSPKGTRVVTGQVPSAVSLPVGSRYAVSFTSGQGNCDATLQWGDAHVGPGDPTGALVPGLTVPS